MEMLESAISVTSLLDRGKREHGGQVWPEGMKELLPTAEGAHPGNVVLRGAAGETLLVVRRFAKGDDWVAQVYSLIGNLDARLRTDWQQRSTLKIDVKVALPVTPEPQHVKYIRDLVENLLSATRISFEVATEPLAAPGAILDGDIAFKLHDTYGFPVDLTGDVCRERGLKVDEARFNVLLEEQKQRAREAGKFKMAQGLEYKGAPTTFHGYEELAHEGAKVTAVYVDGSAVEVARAGDDVVIVLDHTPFYAESGGQVGDAGEFRNATTRVVIDDTLKIQADVFGHHGRIAEGEVKVGDAFTVKVDVERRAKTVRNHSATHLMHKALREVLGGHVQQKGSLVNADRTRFDFAHTGPLTEEQIAKVEAIVNAEILANAGAKAEVMALDDAQKSGAMMLFGEKYGDTVRVLSIGSSKELCGGTHVGRTGDIGLFKIVGEGGVAAGIRRVEAVTGDNALAYLRNLEHTVNGLAGSLKVSPQDVPSRVASVLDQVRALEKEVAALKGKLASSQGDELLAKAVDVKGLKVLAATLEGADAKALRETMDKLKDKLKSAAIVLAAVEGGKVQIAAGVTPDSIAKVKAGELVNFVAQQVGGKGGGKPDMAMAGGTDPKNLGAALASVQGWVAERV
ncbi:MAG: alanine--tRNA ligase [Rhizobacter sp.]|nr:alanine--tRNA ligase [Rhizobacter sp.]